MRKEGGKGGRERGAISCIVASSFPSPLPSLSLSPTHTRTPFLLSLALRVCLLPCHPPSLLFPLSLLMRHIQRTERNRHTHTRQRQAQRRTSARRRPREKKETKKEREGKPLLLLLFLRLLPLSDTRKGVVCAKKGEGRGVVVG